MWWFLHPSGRKLSWVTKKVTRRIVNIIFLTSNILLLCWKKGVLMCVMAIKLYLSSWSLWFTRLSIKPINKNVHFVTIISSFQSRVMLVSSPKKGQISTAKKSCIFSIQKLQFFFLVGFAEKKKVNKFVAKLWLSEMVIKQHLKLHSRWTRLVKLNE